MNAAAWLHFGEKSAVFSGQFLHFFLTVEGPHVAEGFGHGGYELFSFLTIVVLPVLPAIPVAQIEHELPPAADDVRGNHMFEFAGYGVGLRVLQL